jgi:hypothetical protein
MSRMKLVVLSLVAAFALSAVASSTALATHEYLVNGETIAKGSKVEVQGQIMELGQFETEIAKLSIHITCNDAYGLKGEGNVLEAEGKSKLKAEFKACTLYQINGGIPEGEPKCKVAAITATAKGLLTETGIVKFTGLESELFTKFEISEVKGAGTCNFLGKFEVKGSQLCAIPSYGFEGDIGELVCDGVGSKELKLNQEGGTEGNKEAKIYARFAVTGTKGQKLSTNG